MLNLASLNQRVNALTAKINNIVPGGENLADTLLNGNSAGASDLDMNTNDILQVNNIDLTTINGSAYPPVVSADDLTAVLLAGNSAGASDIDMNTNDILQGGIVNAQTFSAVLGDKSVVVIPTSLVIEDTDIPHTTTFTADTISSNGANDFTITSTNSNLALSSSGNITTACSGFVVSAGDYSLTISNTIAESIGSLPLDPITFRRNLAPTTFTSGNPCGLLEKTALNAVTSGTTTFTVLNAFQTTINTPLLAGRIFVLPAPSAGTIGYWYGICNKSTAQTITIQYPTLTIIATIPVASSATNGGSSARFAVDFNGTSYSRIG